MKDFSDLIQHRRSIRKFTAQELSEDEVVTLVKAALMAPTSKRSSSWQFILVDDKALLQKMSHLKEQGASFLADAALAVVVLGDPLLSDVWIEDASVASIYLQLQAADLDLGSCWIQVRERMTGAGTPSDDYLHDLLDLPLQLQTVSIIAIGHKAVEPAPFDLERLKWEKIHLNKFGGQE
ncbi:MAG: nitroreductase family protein [Bacteroidaceae bacterium]|nr:nitroreductase family protein [Bacteroidaceae bacterium]